MAAASAQAEEDEAKILEQEGKLLMHEKQLEEIKAEEGLDEMLFFVVDILKEGHLRKRHGGCRCHSYQGLRPSDRQQRPRCAAGRPLAEETDHARPGAGVGVCMQN